MAPRTPLVAAILGGGMIGGVHAAALHSAGIRLRGVLASTSNSTRDAAERFGAELGYPSLEAVLADDAVDVVHVCTPNQLHAEQSIAALAAGKHVICEKPMTTNVEDAQRLLEAADESGRQLLVPFVYRFHPVVREIRARALRGDFGSWHLLHGSYLQDWLLSPDASNWRVNPAAGGPSRAFADIGTHWFDLVEWITGASLSDVFADFTTAHASRPTGAMKTFTSAALASSCVITRRGRTSNAGSAAFQRGTLRGTSTFSALS